MYNIGVATSGGDAPGMNACVRAIVKAANNKGDVNIYGIRDGILGLMRGEPGDINKLFADDVRNIINLSGTILGTSRLPQINSYLNKKYGFSGNNNDLSNDTIKYGLCLIEKNILEKKLKGLILIGGDDTCKAAHLINQIPNNQLPIYVIPATIDNDIQGTDITIGFDSAVSSALHAIDLIRATASSHKRLFIVEVMGHNRGYIGLEVGLASGAEEILIPEIKYHEKDLKKMADRLINSFHKGQRSALIVVAEGVTFNLPKIERRTKISAAYKLINFLQQEIKDWEIRLAVIGHIQRGAVPTFFTRILASEMGSKALHRIYKSINQPSANSCVPMLIGKKGTRYYWQKIPNPPTKTHDKKLIARRKRLRFLSY